MKRAAFLLFILHSSFFICPVAAQDVTIPFDITQQGCRFTPTWGIDQAWISEQNARKAINHMGKENIGIGRTCFRTTKPLTNDSVLANTEISKMRERNKWLSLVSDTLPVVLTVDQEAGSDEYYVVNKSCNMGHWAANINSHVHWMQENSTHPVVGVSIFNEPDYWSVEEGATTAKQTQIAKLLREEYPRMADVVLTGGNTLNDDKALEWYNPSKAYLEWGNTHQLAGSFNNFAKFYQQVAADGKVGYADEMHNVGEAMVALEYGATIGIWWGFDSRARGEFCDISRHGERIGYDEQRTNWTAASVWRHDDGRVKAFIGSSERQAATTSYRFVSIDRDVYFDGFGPTRVFDMEIPGGKVGSYQDGQTNAERVIDIEWGEDVRPTAITDGVYKLVNKATGNVAAVSGDNIVMQKYTGAKSQQWNVALSDSRVGGDYSFYDFTAVSNPKTRMNLRDFSCLDNANIMAYSRNDKPSSNEQWYFDYAGNGYYYIRNRESALYLAAAASNSTNGTNVVQRVFLKDDNLRDRLLWRLLPTDVTYETDAPAKPTGLLAELMPSAVKLMWDKGPEDDLDGYMVLRAEAGSDDWNTIARGICKPSETDIPKFIDNTVLPSHNYVYKVKAIDRAQNMSEPSANLEASTSGWKDLMAHYTFDGTLTDQTENGRHAVAPTAAPQFDDEHQAGSQSLSFAKGQYLQLPVNIIPTDQFTISFWLRPMNSKAGQRIFDFGYDANHSISLTPYNNNSRMRLTLRNGTADEQTVDCPDRLSLLQWRHITVTMDSNQAYIYIDGQPVASNLNMDIQAIGVPAVMNYIGRDQAGSAQPFVGNLDDLRIYNYTLPADEVAQLYSEALVVTSPTTVPSTVAPSIYSIGGQRLDQPRQGLNIIDGKAVLHPAY